MPAGRRRALHIAILVRSLFGGGEQKRMASLASEFAKAGCEVDVYVTRSETDADALMPPGVRVIDLGARGGSAWKRTSSKRNDYARALIGALERNPPDLLLAAGSASPLAIAVRAKAKLPDLPLVVRASSHPRRSIPWRWARPRLLEPIRGALRRSRYSAADLIIAVAEDVGAGIHETAPDVRLVVLPSPVLTEKFFEDLKLGAAPEHRWLRQQKPLVLSVGRLSVAKDFPTLLRAFALVRVRRDLKLVILGDGIGSHRQELLRLAKKLRIERDVDLQGWVDNVPSWLARASIFVSTSIWEGSPGSIIEALAAGCPIVATDCPGDTRTLLDNGRLGGLAPVGDFRSIAELIERQLDNPPDPQALRAAAAPYRDGSAALAYLQTLGSFVSAWREKATPQRRRP